MRGAGQVREKFRELSWLKGNLAWRYFYMKCFHEHFTGYIVDRGEITRNKDILLGINI